MQNNEVNKEGLVIVQKEWTTIFQYIFTEVILPRQ